MGRPGLKSLVSGRGSGRGLVRLRKRILVSGPLEKIPELWYIGFMEFWSNED